MIWPLQLVYTPGPRSSALICRRAIHTWWYLYIFLALRGRLNPLGDLWPLLHFWHPGMGVYSPMPPFHFLIRRMEILTCKQSWQKKRKITTKQAPRCSHWHCAWFSIPAVYMCARHVVCTTVVTACPVCTHRRSHAVHVCTWYDRATSLALRGCTWWPSSVCLKGLALINLIQILYAMMSPNTYRN